MRPKMAAPADFSGIYSILDSAKLCDRCLCSQNGTLCGITMITFLIARFMGPTRGSSRADRTQVGPMFGPMNFAIWDYFPLFSAVVFFFLQNAIYFCKCVSVHPDIIKARRCAPEALLYWLPYRHKRADIKLKRYIGSSSFYALLTSTQRPL